MIVHSWMSRVLRIVGKKTALLFCEHVPATGLLIAGVILAWVVFGIKCHMLPTVHSQIGGFGQLELPNILNTETEVIEFSAVRVPSRVAWRICLVPETIHITVRYRGVDKTDRLWDHSFIFACDKKGICNSVNTIQSIGLYGRDMAGSGLAEYARVYFPEGKPPIQKAKPLPIMRWNKKPSVPTWIRQTVNSASPVHKARLFYFLHAKMKYGKYSNQRIWSYRSRVL